MHSSAIKKILQRSAEEKNYALLVALSVHFSLVWHGAPDGTGAGYTGCTSMVGHRCWLHRLLLLWWGTGAGCTGVLAMGGLQWSLTVIRARLLQFWNGNFFWRRQCFYSFCNIWDYRVGGCVCGCGLIFTYC